MFFYQQCIEPSMSPYMGPKSTAPPSPLREQQCQGRVLYFFDPGSMRRSRSFIEPWLQCIGSGSILAFIVWHRLRPSHCGCSKCWCHLFLSPLQRFLLHLKFYKNVEIFIVYLFIFLLDFFYTFGWSYFNWEHGSKGRDGSTGYVLLASSFSIDILYLMQKTYIIIEEQG
jgi:hypothetical protein